MSTNISSLVNPDIIKNLKSSNVPKSFGDQLKNNSGQVITAASNSELANLLKEKKTLIEEEIKEFSRDEKKQINYLTLIIPTQQGLKMDAVMNRTPVKINKPKFILDYVGDKEGFFLYWLKKRNFLDIKRFYMTAKFFDEIGRAHV